ncbi:hypothetical protein DFR59_10610 [Falsibacillus pallidus]|uniref:Uncharacterized protein n=1 Tax=Falsibacillus pallidus TaxID=493781 RepID=A0A370GDU4_9BACI|nr:hypothetical protein DFR59_10610 [Falsibacillus pallidus]
MASFRATGFPPIFEVHVTVAVVSTYGALLDTYTGCAPTSVGLIENMIVPVMDAVTVSVIVEMILPPNGADKLFATFLQTWNI